MLNKLLALPTSFGFGNFQITFYSIFILTGAVLALLIGMYKLKKLGYDPHRLENVFLVAFPCGLLGARIWYVIFQFSTEFLPVFKDYGFWEGFGNLFGITSSGIKISGLAIEGGVLFGILAGVLFVIKYRKEMKPLDIADACIPGILLAQAIGRWGNFFNREVYGQATDPSRWSWLGKWFVDQMTINGSFREPLFLVESLVNILGFLILFFVIGTWLKKYLTPGTASCMYFVWYGIVRTIMEPLRDPAFIMNKYISWSTAIAFIVIGCLGLIFIYTYRYYLKKKFNMHLFDRKISDNLYLDFTSDNYIDKNNNIVEKPSFEETKVSEEVLEEKNDEIDKEENNNTETNEIKKEKASKKVKLRVEDKDGKKD